MPELKWLFQVDFTFQTFAREIWNISEYGEAAVATMWMACTYIMVYE
jgi:hypothetical protein